MSIMHASLQTLFGSKTRIDLLTLFITHPGEGFYIRQLASLLKQSPTPVIRELSKLSYLGLVTSEKKANSKYYTVNPSSPILPELRSLILKTVGFGDLLRKRLQNISTLEFAFIYGSFAEQNADLKSDIDLFLIGDVPEKKLIKLIKELEAQIQREIQYSIFSKEEFLKKLKEENDYILHVIKGPKILIIGDENEFRRFAQEGLD